MGDSQYRGNAGDATSPTGTHYAQTLLASGRERSSKLRAKYLRISVQIYGNAIFMLNVLHKLVYMCKYNKPQVIMPNLFVFIII